MLVIVYDWWKAHTAVALCVNIAITGVDTFPAGKHTWHACALQGVGLGPRVHNVVPKRMSS